MARCRDLREGKVSQPMDQFTVTLADGTIKNYLVARQPMPHKYKSQLPKSEFPAEMLKATTKRVSKHLKGWMKAKKTRAQKDRARELRQIKARRKA